MTTISSASTPIFVRKDFTSAPFTYVPLDKEGRLIRKWNVTLEISYNVRRGSTSLADAAMLRIMGLCETLNLCNCRRLYTTIRETHNIELPSLNPEAALDEYLRRLRVIHTRGLEGRVISKSSEGSEVPRYSNELQRKIFDLLHQIGVSVDSEAIAKLLKAREQAILIHIGQREKVVSVSSKSPYFSSINNSLRVSNASLPTSTSDDVDPPSSCLASLRVFPDGTSALTIPGLIRLKGANKAVSCDILISENEASVSLMRRAKILKEKRTAAQLSRFEYIIKWVIGIRSPYVLIPEILFRHPTKGIQTLSTSCVEDFVSFIEPYYAIATTAHNPSDKRVRYILTNPIEEQIRQALVYMKQIAEGMRDMHDSELLHCDIKPENLLRSGSVAKIGDFDFACTVYEGETHRWNMGSLDYVRTDIFYRNMSTELFALARTFWMDAVKVETNACFMHVFDALEQLSKREQPDLASKIAKLKMDLKILCSNMKSDKLTPRGHIELTYDDVILALQKMAVPFASIGHESAATGAGAAAGALA